MFSHLPPVAAIEFSRWTVDGPIQLARVERRQWRRGALPCRRCSPDGEIVPHVWRRTKNLTSFHLEGGLMLAREEIFIENDVRRLRHGDEPTGIPGCGG